MLLKEIYNQSFLKSLYKTALLFDKKFDDKKFFAILKNIDEKELKERMRLISLALNESLSPKSYQEKVEILKKTALKIPKDKNSGLALIIFPDFVEVFGLDYFEFSLKALEFFTEFGSAEFAVRQFIKLDEEKSLKIFDKFSKSKNYHVRRLASEGLRPMLPWGEALKNFKKDPNKIVPILENLKHDKEIYVRKSVANNLNDISKNQPDLVIALLSGWKKQNVPLSLIRHALRTLLKQGNIKALELIDIKANKNYNIQSFALQKNAVKISKDLIFDFILENKLPQNKIRLEYAIYFLKKNQSYLKKNFQITTKNFDKGKFSFSKKHSFKDMSTRKHNAGLHMISLIVNGIKINKLQFELI